MKKSFSIIRPPTLPLFLKFSLLLLITVCAMSACAMLTSKESRLISSIQTGDAATAKEMIESTNDLNFITESDTFPLLEAAYAGNIDLVKLILARSADINLQNQKGVTALMAATYHEHQDIVEYLILEEANLSLKNFKKYTALHLAVASGNRAIMDLLLEQTDSEAYSGKDGISLLTPAIDNEDATTTAWLLAKGVFPDSSNGKILSPLTTAALSPNPEIVKLLLEHGADVHARDENGCDTLWMLGTLNTPFLMEKIYSLADPEFFKTSPIGTKNEPSRKIRIGFQSLLRNLELITDSIDPQPQIQQLNDRYDFGFLFSNISTDTIDKISDRLETDYRAVSNQLLAAGADINTTDKRKRSILNMLCNQKEKDINALFDDTTIPLDPFARNRLLQIIEQTNKIHAALIQPFIKKTEINQPDEYGNTPLLLACAKDARNFAPVLIQTGANTNHANNDGWTPLITAAYAGKYEIAHLLLQNGAHVNTANKYGETALLKAVYNNDVPMVKLLLEYGGDIHKANKHGDSPIGVAKKREYKKILVIFGEK